MTITKIRDLANDRNIHLQNLHDGDLWAINSGFDNLDRKTGKFRSGDLVVIGARPVMGRSTFAENLVYNIAKHNDPHHNVLFFSMETPSATIVDKFAAKISDIDPWKLRVGMLKDADIKSLEQATAEIAKLPILVDDTFAKLKVRPKQVICSVLVVLFIADFIYSIDHPNTGQGITSEIINTVINHDSN